jgi:hypothetical protein
MNLTEISQIAVALGTIASIIYAAIQIRSNAKAVRASTIQHFVDSFTSHWDDLARNPEFSSLMLRGTDDFQTLDRLEKMQFRFALTSLMRRWENVWKHLNDGTRKDSDLPSTQFQEAIVSAPGFAAAWELVKVQSGGDFIKHVDKLIAGHTATTSNTAPEKKVLTPILGDTQRLPSQSLRRKRKQR